MLGRTVEREFSILTWKDRSFWKDEIIFSIDDVFGWILVDFPLLQAYDFFQGE